MIAAQWTNCEWVLIGEITGSDGREEVNGVYYDNVLPVEIEVNIMLNLMWEIITQQSYFPLDCKWCDYFEVRT